MFELVAGCYGYLESLCFDTVDKEEPCPRLFTCTHTVTVNYKHATMSRSSLVVGLCRKIQCFKQEDRLETEGMPVPVSALRRQCHYEHN